MEGGTTSSARKVLNEEVELVHTLMDTGMVNTVQTTETVDKFKIYLLVTRLRVRSFP